MESSNCKQASKQASAAIKKKNRIRENRSERNEKEKKNKNKK
jgi:hypothetical protein